MALEDYGKKKFTEEDISKIRHWFLSCKKYYKPLTPREQIEKRMEQFRQDMEKELLRDTPSLFDHEPEDSTFTTAQEHDIWSTKYDWAEDRLNNDKDDKKDADRWGFDRGNLWGIGNFEFKNPFTEGYVPFSRRKKLREQEERNQAFEDWLDSLP